MRKSPLLLLYPAFLALTLLLAPVRVADALQKPERFVLDNGMVILLMERHALPMVMVNLSFRAGSVWSPPGQEGVAELTATLLTAGTKTRSVKEIPQAIEFVGGALGASAGHDMLGVSLKVLKKDIELGFDLLSDVIKHPTFPPKELERERQEFLAELARQEEEPMTVASKTFSRLVFGPHPYGRPSDGTKESLSQITREQVLQFYKAYLRPQNAVMVVVGDITLQELQDLLDKYFSDWRAGKPEYPALTPAPPLKKREVKVIPKSITQSTVIWGHLGISRSNPDFYALSVANYILGGGGFASRLLTQIRDNMGLAYSVRSAFYANTYPGSFRVSADEKRVGLQSSRNNPGRNPPFSKRGYFQ